MTSTPLLSQAIKYLKGVGPRRAELLSKELHIDSLGDLLYTFPFRYIDRSEVHEIQALQEGMPYVQIRGRFISFSEEGEGRKKRISAVFTDGTGYVDVVWFAGLKYVKETLRYDETYLLLGTPKLFARTGKDCARRAFAKFRVAAGLSYDRADEEDGLYFKVYVKADASSFCLD